jgi:hypothetical protein
MNKQEHMPMPVVSTRNPNWRIWMGFLAVAAKLPWPFCEIPYHAQRLDELADVRRSGVAAAGGNEEGFREPRCVPRKNYWPDPCGGEFGNRGLFGYATMYASRQLPRSMGVPRVGVNAPEFTLADTSH